MGPMQQPPFHMHRGVHSIHSFMGCLKGSSAAARPFHVQRGILVAAPAWCMQACGSGGTAAGLALGLKLAGCHARVHAYGVCDTPSYFYSFCDGLLDGLYEGVLCCVV
eukprot:353600-Chlamydomonas_euryale.AAC.6